MVLERAKSQQRLAHCPASVRVHPKGQLRADRLADRDEVGDVLPPALGVARLHAEHLDAEFMEWTLCIGDHLSTVVGHTAAPFTGDERMCEASDQVIDAAA